MDENLTKQLRDAGGLVGFSNVDDWQRLIDSHGIDQVLAAVVRVKKVSGRGAFISGVRVDLGAKGREPAPPKPGSSLAPGGPCAAAATTLDEIDIERGERKPDEHDRDVAEQIEDDDQSDEAIEQVEEDEAPAEKAASTPEQDRMQRARQARTFRVTDHYLNVLREFPGISLTEFANRAGRDPGAVTSWLSTHTDLVTKTGDGRKGKRYWLKDDPRITEAAAEAERRPAAPIPKSTPCAQVTPTVEESAPAAPEVVQPPSAPELVTGEDLRAAVLPEVRFDAEITAVARLSVIFAPDEFAGPLRPLLEKLLDVFAQRRGYTHTVRELADCQDLVGVRR